MRTSQPLEVHRGYCFANTEFKQGGKTVNMNDAMQHLARYSDSAPYVRAGNAYAVGSIGATIVATSTLTVGLLGTNDAIKMSDGATTALIATGASVAVLSWVLCITSDGQYVQAAEVYNRRFDRQTPEPAAKNAPPVVREPGDDGDYRGAGSPQKTAPGQNTITGTGNDPP